MCVTFVLCLSVCINGRQLPLVIKCTNPTSLPSYVHTNLQVQDFIDCLSGPSSLYGLESETLDSLMLSLLPPMTHKYESHKELSVMDESFKEPSVVDESLKEPSVMDKSLKETDMIDNCLDLKRLLMTKLLQSLHHYAGFHILPVSIARLMGWSHLLTSSLPSLQHPLDELHLDTDCLFELVLSDPEFDGLLPNLSYSAAVQAVSEAMSVLHSAPALQVSCWNNVR